MATIIIGKNKGSPPVQDHSSQRLSRGRVPRWGSLFWLALIVVGMSWYNGNIVLKLKLRPSANEPLWGHEHQCRPPLPPLLHSTPPESLRNHPAFQHASNSLDRYLSHRASQPDVDSISFAVVTPNEIVFQKGYGLRRANESSFLPLEDNQVDETTIYRIASVSKMFAVLQGMILKEKGLMDWDDPVERFLPNFTYHGATWNEFLGTNNEPDSSFRGFPSITLRQLASHLSGIGRDYPPLSLSNWPHQIDSPTAYHVPTREEILLSIAKYPLIAPGNTLPSYSNSGFNLLGYAITAAANSTSTYADLLHRDVFEPLGLSSSFNVTAKNVEKVAVSASNSDEVDIDFTDAHNAAGGQYSSLDDLIKVMQGIFLNPKSAKNIISASTVAEWLRPILYGFDDNLTELGMPWEIIKLKDSHGVFKRFYAKSGNLFSSHAQFAFSPASSYGVIALSTGSFANMAQLVVEGAIHRFQHAFDRLQTHTAEQLYAGRWSTVDEDPTAGKSEAHVEVHRGTLWLSHLVINGTDVLAKVATAGGPNLPPHSKEKYALWWTGRQDEFRIAFGRPGLNHWPFAGCEPFWVSFDPFFAQGAPIDLLLFEGGPQEATDDQRSLYFPSTQTRMHRVPTP